MKLIHIIALKDNKIYDLQKENERLKKALMTFRNHTETSRQIVDYALKTK